jgi:hypothetical protein
MQRFGIISRMHATKTYVNCMEKFGKKSSILLHTVKKWGIIYSITN